jgi:hypothetical protein
MRLMLVTLLALLLLPAAAVGQEPVVVTGPAEGIGETSATLTGTIDPEGTARQYHFEVGTTSAYGLQTATQTTGAGTEPEPVSALVQGLSPATTYHYRLVADGVAGQDRTFVTAAAPARPWITRLRVSERTATSARISARVDPNGAPTTWYVEWGTSSSLGNRTPDQALPAGPSAVPVSIVLDGLPSYTRIHWRLVAANSIGVRRTSRRSFVTARAPSGVTLSVLPPVTTWSRTVSIGGSVRGSGVSGLTVALQQSSFPYDAGFHQVDTARTDRNGLFRFAPRAVFVATQYRAVPLAAPQLASAVVQARVRSRVRVHRGRKTRRAVWLTGAVNPGLPSGRATLQRRVRGRWRAVRRVSLTTLTELRSSYAFKVRRARAVRRYRVTVAARDGGAHARGYSRSISVGRRR